jgi:hypothetical protein
MKNVQIPIAIKKALINKLPLKKDEIILKTIYNNKCVSLKTLWSVLPRNHFNEINTKSQLKENFLRQMVKEGALRRDQAQDYPKFFKAGYAVNLEKAYKNKLPYTLMDLNPLPALEREDYIYYLILHQDEDLIYQIFPEEKHEMIDMMKERVIYIMEKLGEESQKLLETSIEDLREEEADENEKDKNVSNIKI